MWRRDLLGVSCRNWLICVASNRTLGRSLRTWLFHLLSQRRELNHGVFDRVVLDSCISLLVRHIRRNPRIFTNFILVVIFVQTETFEVGIHSLVLSLSTLVWIIRPVYLSIVTWWTRYDLVFIVLRLILWWSSPRGGFLSQRTHSMRVDIALWNRLNISDRGPRCLLSVKCLACFLFVFCSVWVDLTV